MFPILPYICTKTIITCGSYKLYSQDLIDYSKEDQENYIKNNDTAKMLSNAKKIEEMILHKDSLHYSIGDTLVCNSKPSNIKNVAILYNGCTRSAAELLIIYLKQSSKTTTFGERSGGVVDNLDMIAKRLPS
jgi:C-terminal processing protease CtpA/Prc